MPYKTLINTRQLAGLVAGQNPVVIDCRFDLADTGKGERAYAVDHIPLAFYAHLDRDLSGDINAGTTGRHPLPLPTEAAARFSDWGIDRGRQVVAYDNGNGAIASRLWWMLNWLGHDKVAVLDGGWTAWLANGGEKTDKSFSPDPATFVVNERDELLVDVGQLSDAAFRKRHLVMDARAVERYRGDIEPIDPVAGHIPGAICTPFAGNLDVDNRFLQRIELRKRFQSILGNKAADEVVFYCGSGVTAAHNVFAFVHAGLGWPKLYAGSWSEWITDPSRPIATGDDT